MPLLLEDIAPLWKATWFRIMLALLVTVAAYVGLRWMAFRRYRQRLRQVTRREALSLERQRIAMDMHDDLGADLSDLLMRTRMALDEGTDPHAMLMNVEQRVSGMMNKIDRIIWSLDPRMDGLGSTLDFIEQQAVEQAEGAGLILRSSISPLAVDRRVSASFRRDLHLLVKEALNNVVKHAGASTVHLSILSDPARLNIVVEDDGRGIDEGTLRSERHGRGNMQKRAVNLSGTVHLSRMKDRGTRCEITVPFPRNHTKR